MKIEGFEPNPNVKQAATPADDTQARKGGKAGHGTPAKPDDTVELSQDAQLARRAFQAASAVPEVRQDRVQLARQKLESGLVGSDANRLADTIVTSLLEG